MPWRLHRVVLAGCPWRTRGNRVLDFLRRHFVLSFAFALAVLLTLFFLTQFVVSSLRWSGADRIDQPIAGWMTPRYVVRSWDVPPSVVADALGLTKDGTGRRITLEDLAAAQGRDLDEMIEALAAAIAAGRVDDLD